MRLRADRREERRSEAEARNKAWRSLSAAEKINSLKQRPGKSLRQMAALLPKEKS